jgi:ATP-dependent exoDNAse (exonuclease V), alpha subunit - helicase superfamily I member
MPNSIELHNIYRQAEGNGIIEAARRINKGQFFTSNGDAKLHVHDAVLHMLYKMLDTSDIDWKSLDNQIISPARKTDIGTVRLNGVLQARYNTAMLNRTELPRNKWEQKNKLYVAEGDKVVCTVNSYDLRDYEERYTEFREDEFGNPVGFSASYIPPPETKQMLNGEVGIILSIDEAGTLEIDFGDRTVELPPLISDYSMRYKRHIVYDPRKAIDLAYALTTHKCQGSEYSHVTYLMASCAFFNLSRPNFYTGITRAHSHVDIITDQRALAVSLKSLGFKPKNKLTSQLKK